MKFGNTLSEYSAVNASRFLRLIHQKSLLLAENPFIGIARADLSASLRFFPVGHYVIFYHPIADGIEIVRVLHAGRDIDCEF